MKPFEIFKGLSEETGASVLCYIRDGEHKDVYKTTLATLASLRKLRPVFVQKKTKDAQVKWMLGALKRRDSDQVAEHLLQLWLMKCHSGMLVQFLDGAGISHDGEGMVDELPESLEAEKVKSAVDGILEDYPAEAVAVYLAMFQLQRSGGWPEIAGEIESRPELALGGAA